MRVLALSGLEQGVNYPFQQWYAGAGLGFQFAPILREHFLNIDPDKEHYLLLGAGYEYLKTKHSGSETHENRLTLDATPAFLFPGEILVRDRNWLELRWINGRYSTTYRNQVSLERTFLVGGLRVSPFGSYEVFYDSTKHSWDDKWFTAGFQWPYKRLFMLQTYYRRESCGSCSPAFWNAGGVTFNFFFGNGK